MKPAPAPGQVWEENRYARRKIVVLEVGTFGRVIAKETTTGKGVCQAVETLHAGWSFVSGMTMTECPTCHGVGRIEQQN